MSYEDGAFAPSFDLATQSTRSPREDNSTRLAAAAARRKLVLCPQSRDPADDGPENQRFTFHPGVPSHLFL